MVFVTLCGALFIIGGLFAAWFFIQHAPAFGPISFWFAAICLLFILLGAYALLVAFSSSLTLFENRIEITGLKGLTVIFREEIEGWQFAPDSPAEVVLFPRDKLRHSITVGQLFSVDPPLVEWLRQIPQIDKQSASISEVVKAPWIGWALNLLGVMTLFVLPPPVVAFGRDNPDSYRLAILAVIVLPWLCLLIVWKSRGYFHLRFRPRDPKLNLSLLFSVPVVIIAARAFEYNLLTHAPLLKLAPFLALAMFLAARRADRTASAQSFIALAAIYGYGVSAEVNALFDRSTAVIYRVGVSDKQVLTGKHRSYRLYLEPWGPQPALNQIDVTRGMYDRIQPGDIIQLSLKDGALGAPWYYIVHPI